ncbi:MAG: UDP-N-acetylglucosamine 4,6-dehydratase (inverting) [Gammaproteobacteria bacterium]
MNTIPASRSILVTGGTGSFGRRFVEVLLERRPDLKRLVVFSRDELKQHEMALELSPERYPCLRYFLGDVRDLPRLRRALEGIDTVVHAAALKQVPTAEYNPFEFIKTNVLGAENLIEAVLDSQVHRVVALSTDKAAAPINLYGATKLCSDKLFIAANNLRGHRQLAFAVVRYGNVMGSRGSVIPFFLEQRQTGVLPITDPAMTRFNITLDEGVELVLDALNHSLGGEIYVPKIPSYRVSDVAEAIGPHCRRHIVGIRPGEKLHEEMITETDALQTIETDARYLILPALAQQTPAAVLATYCAHHKGQPVARGFSYNSRDNTQWLTVQALRELIRRHVDPGFKVDA